MKILFALLIFVASFRQMVSSEAVNFLQQEADSQLQANSHAQAGTLHWDQATSAGDWTTFENEINAALVEYRIAESLQPTNPVYRADVATALIRLGRYEEAIPKLKAAIQLRDDPWFRNELCVALKRLDRFQESDANCVQAVKNQGYAQYQDKLEAFLKQHDDWKNQQAHKNGDPSTHPDGTSSNTQIAAWVFGGILLLFLMAVVAYRLISPKATAIDPTVQNILGFFCATLAGLFAFFMTGVVLVNILPQ